MKQFCSKSAQMGHESKWPGKLRYWLFRCLASQYSFKNTPLLSLSSLWKVLKKKYKEQVWLHLIFLPKVERVVCRAPLICQDFHFLLHAFKHSIFCILHQFGGFGLLLGAISIQWKSHMSRFPFSFA